MEPSPELGKAGAEADRDLVDLMNRCEMFMDGARREREQAIKTGDIEKAKKIENAMFEMNETIGLLRFNGHAERFGPSALVPRPRHDTRSPSGSFSPRGSQGHLMRELERSEKAMPARPYQPGGPPGPGLQLVPSKMNPQVRRWQGQPKPQAQQRQPSVNVGVSLHNKLVDAKPDRPLTGAGAQHISQVVPNARHVPYEQVPGLDKMHAKMGAGPDADFKKYQDARDAAFNTHGKKESVPIKDLHFTQPNVNRKRVDELAGVPDQLNKPSQVVRVGGKHYLMNGHHRVAAQHVAGQEQTPAQVLDLDEQEQQSVQQKGENWNKPDEETERIAQQVKDFAEKIVNERGLNEEFAQLRDKVNGGTQTKELHSDAGQYTSHRRQLHNRIIEGALHNVPSQAEPRVVYMGGVPGSGKSTIVKMRGFNDFVHIDSDDVKRQLPEYQGWNAALLQDEATDVVGDIVAKAEEGRKNILIDCTMKSVGQYLDQIKTFRQLGYKVGVVFADLPPEKAIERAIDRYKNPKGDHRFVDPRYIATHDHKNRKSYEQVKQQADFFAAYNNDVPLGSEPVLLEKHGE